MMQSSFPAEVGDVQRRHRNLDSQCRHVGRRGANTKLACRVRHRLAAEFETLSGPSQPGPDRLRMPKTEWPLAACSALKLTPQRPRPFDCLPTQVGALQFIGDSRHGLYLVPGAASSRRPTSRRGRHPPRPKRPYREAVSCVGAERKARIWPISNCPVFDWSREGHSRTPVLHAN